MSEQHTFDNQTYSSAKTYLKSALEHVVAMGRSTQDLIEFSLEKFGDAMLPYLQQFLHDVKSGEIKVKGLTKAKLDKMLGHTSLELREQMIRNEAWLMAENRGFVGGSPMEDWLKAEQAVDSRLAAQMGLVARGRKALTSLGEVLESEYGQLKESVSNWFGVEEKAAPKAPKDKVVKSAPTKPAAAMGSTKESASAPVSKNKAAVKKKAAAKKTVAKKSVKAK